MIKTFGKFIVEALDPNNPKDMDIQVIGFDMELVEDGRDAVLEILDYIKEQLN